MARIPFRARARTIDHLGREQIADCPTAVSELWKNAYDAYARAVGLHLFGGEVPVAVVCDDGHGMSAEEFVDRWLMLGTESKAGVESTRESDRNGLEVRPRQGQKGIGRLSVGYLGSTVVVLSKRRDQPYVAALVDWRLFQNPYLSLDEVEIPVEEFTAHSEFPAIVERLLQALVDNVWGVSEDPERGRRVAAAWSRYAQEQRLRGEQATDQAIAAVAVSGAVTDEHLRVWPVWNGLSEHGTALVVLDTVRELRVWTDVGLPEEDDEIRDVKDKLRFTLTGFADPYTGRAAPLRYEAVAHTAGREERIVSWKEVFDLNELRDLEHVVEGRFDEAGVFQGRVTAWSKKFGEVTVPPLRPPPTRGQGFVGPFEIAFGTFELDPKNSSLPADVITRLRDRARRFSGLAVYRDGLRVQPYGRPSADFFGMEVRRSEHAGRGFWAHRRTFGRVAISRGANPHLRDKAGREGLIDTHAAREFRLLVENLLKVLAHRYFGSDAPIRTAEVAEAQARYRRGQESEEKANKKRLSELREAIRAKRPSLDRALALVASVTEELDQQPPDLAAISAKLDEVRASRDQLALPPRPRQLPSALEERYRRFRDDLANLGALLDTASKSWIELMEIARKQVPAEIARDAAAVHAAFIASQLSHWRKAIGGLLNKEQARVYHQINQDEQRYTEHAEPLIRDVVDQRRSLPEVLSDLEELRSRLFSELRHGYEGYIRAISTMSQGIDIDAALSWSVDERIALAERVDQWQRLAQLGITVEIIGHELNETAAQVFRSLEQLPKTVQQTEGYRAAVAGFSSLLHRLEFLAPLRLSGARLRETLSGRDIEAYLREFFARLISERRVDLVATDAFRNFCVTDYPSRIYPVFTNLVNNALYWVTFSSERKIILDAVGNKVYVADTGPGVDPDDVQDLFNIFFTRRVNGHGVGLYLSQINLAQGRHRIRYADTAERISSGANFVIEFHQDGEDHA